LQLLHIESVYIGKHGDLSAMTMRVCDIAPIEAQLEEISERLLQISAGPHQATPGQDLLLDPDYLDAAKSMLAALSSDRQTAFVDAEPLTEEEINLFGFRSGLHTRGQKYTARVYSANGTSTEWRRAVASSPTSPSLSLIGNDSDCVECFVEP
jgi:hypothetical protein